MKRILLIFPLAAILLFAACNQSDDDSSPVMSELNLNFRSTFGDEPLVMFERTYDYPENMKLKMQLFQFYLSDIRLLRQANGGTEEVPVLDVALLSYADVYTDEAASQGISLSKLQVPAGEYTGLKFGFGITPELNTTIPPDYELGHPLSENYWEDASSYIFFKIEGNADLDGSGNFADKLTFHVGGDGNYRELAFNTPFVLSEGQAFTLPFEVDLRRLLVDSESSFLDFRQVKQSHSNTSPAADFIADNITEAVTLK